MLGNITSALEMKYEQMKTEDQPLFTVYINMVVKNKDDEEQETTESDTEAPLHLYNGDSVFDAVYRFCQIHGMNIYEHGQRLEEIVFSTFQQLLAESQQESRQLTEIQDAVFSENEDVLRPVAQRFSKDPIDFYWVKYLQSFTCAI